MRLAVAAVAFVLGIGLLSTSRAAAPLAPAADPEMFLLDPDGTEALPGWRLRMGALASDNIRRAPDGETEEIVGAAEYGANWRYSGARAAAMFDGTLGYRHYTQDTFDDEARANFIAAANWMAVPGTFDWFIMDRLANAPIDPLATASPSNVQFVNVLETGPRLTLRPGSVNELTLAASAADVRAEESDIDHERGSASGSFMHGLSANSSVGVVVNARNADFENDAEAVDFDQREAYVTYQRRRETVNMSLAGGMAEVELADGIVRDTAIGWFRIGARRTSDSYLYAGVERRAGDTASAMLRDQLLLEQGAVSSIAVTGDPYFSESATLRYAREWRAHEWSIAATAGRTDYFVSLLDQEQRGINLGADLLLTRRLLLQLDVSGSDIDYLDLGRQDEVRSYAAAFDYRIDRAWSLISGLRYLDRNSTDPAYGFSELMLTLFFSYSPGGREPFGGEN